MASSSSIGWTEATWNPATGCTKVSAGCRNCYAERVSQRLRVMGQKKYAGGFGYAEHPELLDLPLHWKRPRMIFTNSMSDLFHEAASPEFVMRCFETMRAADRHTFQVLTKRPKRMREFSLEWEALHGGRLPPNVWMGTSVEDNGAVWRIRELAGVACDGVRFVSFEPLLERLGPVDLRGVGWAIIGGESGPGHRPCREAWVESLVAQCRVQDVPVFFKQWGGARPGSGGRVIGGRTLDEYPRTERAAAGDGGGR